MREFWNADSKHTFRKRETVADQETPNSRSILILRFDFLPNLCFFSNTTSTSFPEKTLTRHTRRHHAFVQEHLLRRGCGLRRHRPGRLRYRPQVCASGHQKYVWKQGSRIQGVDANGISQSLGVPTRRTPAPSSASRSSPEQPWSTTAIM